MCVVSLEPFDTEISREVDMIFAPEPRAIESARPVGPIASPCRGAPGATGRVAAAPDRRPRQRRQQDPPDPIVDGRIDLGSVALEFLTLSLDLYPRKPGVHFSDVSVGDKDEAQPSPFAALQRFKDRS